MQTNDMRDQLAAMLRPLVDKRHAVVAIELPSITNWLRRRLQDDNLSDLAPGRTVAPRDQRLAALGVLDDLSGEPASLCHGDASTWNVLLDESGGLLLIDPRGMGGDPIYDVAVVALKGCRHLPRPAAANYFARRLNLDPGEIEAWMEIADAARVVSVGLSAVTNLRAHRPPILL